MPPEPLNLVLQRLDAEPPVFFAKEGRHELASSWDHLHSTGLLRAITPSNSALCVGCSPGYVNRVEWVLNTRTGKSEPFMPCPECGPTRVAPDDLRRSVVDIPNLLGKVVRAARGRGTPNEVVLNHVWHLGRVTWCKRLREVYFIRCVHNDNRSAVLAAIETHPKAVLLFPTEWAARRSGLNTKNPIVALETVVSLGPDGLTFDSSIVESRLVDAGYAEPKPKPPRKRGEPAAKIELLVRELRAHLRAARAHAFSLRDLGREPELLPRPTQKELAERCGLSTTAVSRYVNDRDDKLLQLLWDTALHLDQVMKFHGPVISGSEG